MFRLDELKAGDFIDCENYYKEISNPDNDNTKLIEIIQKFFVLLNNKVPTKEEDYLKIIKEYVKQLTEIKETYVWIFNPPSVTPSTTSKENNNLGNELRVEFAEDYKGYIELIYVLCNGKYLDIPKVLEMKTRDFLFWGEYAIRKRLIEQVK